MRFRRTCLLELSTAARLLIRDEEVVVMTAEIETIPLFAALSPAERARVASVARLVQFKEGQVVVNEGEFAFDFYAITQGAADVHRSGENLASLGPGDVFGEFGVVPGAARRWTRRRGASVIARAPTQAIVIDGGDFRRLTEDIPALGDAIRDMAAQREPT
jgi:CRP/FNR family transcriptional regulator, cyclic AMP receptor protein